MRLKRKAIEFYPRYTKYLESVRGMEKKAFFRRQNGLGSITSGGSWLPT